jgi:hypothetical protein
MKKIAMLPVFIFIFASMIYPQSLADLAEKEKARREQVQSDIKIMISNNPAPSPETPQTAGAKSEPEKEKKEEKAAAKPSQADQTDPDEPVDLNGKPESYWRKTMAEARKKVADLEEEANNLAQKRTDLQTQFTNMDDGFARESVQREIQKNIYQQDLNKANLEKAKAALQDLEKEARASGALPGWVGH